MQITLFSILLTFFISTNLFSQSALLINEIMASNSRIPDDEGDYSDWIEIYNKGNSAVNLAEFYLSDDQQDLLKWKFPQIEIAAGDFLIIYASDKNAGNHANFKIDADGEFLFLSSLEGITDSLFTGEIPPDISFGRYEDGEDQWFYFNQPTPGTNNSETYFNGIEDEPVFSSEAGFYDNEISLTISSNNSSSEIYYTLDGSEPDKNSNLFTQAISFTSTSVVRAKAFGENSIPSNTISKTYFLDESFTLPVISLTTDPDNFWDEDSGIYVLGKNAEPVRPYYGANFWQDWEKPVHIEFFEPSGEIGFAMDAGVKIHGGWTREYAQKSLAIFARSIYGKGSIGYQIFPNLSIDKFESIILRNSGNDWGSTFIRDALMTKLGSETGLDVQAYRPAIVFINGEYWGIHNIREKISEHFIESHHNVETDNLNLLEDGNLIMHGTNESYLNLIQYINNNSLSIHENYEHVKELIDIENFRDYMLCQIFYDNKDWPGTNIRYWQAISPASKWRWILFDTDYGFGIDGGDIYKYNTLEFATEPNGPDYPNPPWSTFLLRNLLENEEFKRNFINRFSDLLNTIFKKEHISEIIDTLANVIKPEMEKHRARWSQSYNGWQNGINYLHTYAENRDENLITHFQNKFSLDDLASVNLDSDSEKGVIKISSLTIKEFPWSGRYFKNHEIQITAMPLPGYKFSHWEGYDSNSKILSELPENVSDLTAIFEADTAYSNIVINEINYHSADISDSEDWVELYNNTNSAINLSGWIFKDEDDTHVFEIPEGLELLPDSYLVLCRDTSMFLNIYPDVENFIGNLSFGFDGNGELLRLYDNNLNLIDSVRYDDQLPWPEEADGNGSSLSLVDPDSDNTLAENWKASVQTGTPGEENDVFVSADEESDNIPGKFLLDQNYPNPFNPSTRISFSIPEQSQITLKVYDILGREIKTLISEYLKPGSYNIDFNADNLPAGRQGLSSGIYFYVLKADNKFNQAKKMILIR